MTFSPILPATGLVGWNFLKQTVTQQKEAFSSTGAVDREISYFRENFSKINSAEDLVSDRSLLKVALGSFGLSSDLDNKFFINKIISDGTTDDKALSNLLADKRYKELATAFDFSNPSIKFSDFSDEIISKYIDQSFEAEIGNQNETFRLALNLERTLSDVGNRASSNDTKWFTIMGNPPLREVFEVALGAPSSFGALPIDNQLSEFKKRSESIFGTSSISELSQPELQEKITQKFLLQSQVNEILNLNPQSTALTLLQGI